MSGRRSINILSRFLSVAAMFSVVMAAFDYHSFAEEKPFSTKGPVVITSSTLTADNKAHTALFEGTVVAKTESVTIFSDKMLVYYTEDGKLTKIEAGGKVKVIKGERVITSDEAVYYADEEKVVFTGQPKAIEGPNMLTGTKITYMIKDDRSLVENSKVFMEHSPKNR
jgi:lipopolysaccharide export system protein LptA